MRTGIIYKHTFPNRKAYFGKTLKSLKARIRKDFSGYQTQPLLWRAIQKYGTENITTEIVYKNVPENLLDKIEKLCIKYGNGHTSLGGYNTTWGGEGVDSETAKRVIQERIENGTHNFSGDKHPSRTPEGRERNRKTALKRVADGTNPFLGTNYETHNNATDQTRAAWKDAEKIREIRESGIFLREIANRYGVSVTTIRRILKNEKSQSRGEGYKTTGPTPEEGTHNFLGGEIQRETAQKRVKEGTHNFLGGEIQRKTNHKRWAAWRERKREAEVIIAYAFYHARLQSNYVIARKDWDAIPDLTNSEQLTCL